MNNTPKYTSLTDYSLQISREVRNFDSILFSKPPKQMGSFSVSLKELENTLDNIKKAQEMLEQMKKMTPLDVVAKKENKSARKAGELISDIRTELKSSISRLQEQYFKQLETCYKQYTDVSRAIKDPDDKKRFSGDRTMKFRLMMNEGKHQIPFINPDELGSVRTQQAKSEHKEKEEQIDRISSLEQDDANKLEEALSALTVILAMNPINDLSKDVRKEVAEIKKALPPKTITIAKESLEKLRHSSHLLLDLEQISEIMETTHRFMGSDGKLQKINKQLEALQPLLQAAIKEEKERHEDIKKEHDEIQSKVDYATDAVKTYGTIIDGNSKLEQEQIRIQNNTHGLQAENERLRKDEKRSYADARELETKDERFKEWDDGLKADRLYEQARQDSGLIKENEAYMADKMKQKPVTSLPLEYTEMKKRLKNVSSLYQMNMAESQKLSSGGMSR